MAVLVFVQLDVMENLRIAQKPIGAEVVFDTLLTQ